MDGRLAKRCWRPPALMGLSSSSSSSARRSTESKAFDVIHRGQSGVKWRRWQRERDARPRAEMEKIKGVGRSCETCQTLERGGIQLAVVKTTPLP